MRRVSSTLAKVGCALIAVGPAGGVAQAAVSRSLPLPAGFSPSSFTAVSDSDWWVLGGYGCAAPGSKCDAAIAHTTDGGRSFTRVPSPSTHEAGVYKGNTIAGVSQIAFADDHDGWADGTGLWSTHDGGRTWTRIHTPGAVSDVVAGGGYVYAAVNATASSRDGTETVLWRSSIGTNTWRRLTGAGPIAGPISVHGEEVVVQSADDDRGNYAYGPSVLVSRDAGTRFTRYRAPNPDLPNDLDLTSDSTLWDLGISGGPSGTVFRSVNAGRSFTDVEPASEARDYPNDTTTFAGASDTVAVLALYSARDRRHGGSLYRTTDGGTRWTLIGPRNLDWTYLGFTDPSHGAGIADNGSSSVPALYYTSDAGVSYRRISIP